MCPVKASHKLSPSGFISGCHYVACLSARMCVHAVWCVTARQDFCPSLWPAFCETAGGMDVLESFRISGKINGRIKLNVIWIAVKGRIVWQALGKQICSSPFLIGSRSLFCPSKFFLTTSCWKAGWEVRLAVKDLPYLTLGVSNPAPRGLPSGRV